MSVCKSGNRNPIGIGGLTCRHFHIQKALVNRLQLTAPGCSIGSIARAHNSRARALSITADQFHLVAYPASAQLVVFDFIRNAAIWQTKQRAFVVSGSPPGKGKLHVRELLIGDLIPEKHVPLRGSDCEGNLVDLLVRSRRRCHRQRPARPGQLLRRLGGFGDGNAAHDLCILRLCSGQAYAKPEQVLVQLIAAYGKRLRVARGTGNALCVPGQDQRQLRGRNFPAVGALISVLLIVAAVVRGGIGLGFFRSDLPDIVIRLCGFCLTAAGNRNGVQLLQILPQLQHRDLPDALPLQGVIRLGLLQPRSRKPQSQQDRGDQHCAQAAPQIFAVK